MDAAPPHSSYHTLAPSCHTCVLSPPSLSLQEENMVTNEELRQKYKSAEEMEDDFM